MKTAKRIPIVQGVFEETPDGPRLLGSRCHGCGVAYFPRTPVCRNPDCDDKRVEDIYLSPRGTIWTYTIQYFKPPLPARFDEPFQPYGVAMVDLPERIRVLGMVSTDRPEDLKIGQEVELVIEPAYHDEEGNEVVTWKFRPL